MSSRETPRSNADIRGEGGAPRPAPTGSEKISIGSRPYSWVEPEPSTTPSLAWAHHGIIAVDDGFVSASADGNSLIHVRSGTTRETGRLPVTECHGMTLDRWRGDPSIWIADNGRKAVHDLSPTYARSVHDGQVIRVGMDGRVLQRLSASSLPEPLRKWRPCSIAVEDTPGGGRIWVADGYGKSVVHCFDPAGDYSWTRDGTESGARFDTPHGIVLDTRRERPRLIVADRGNRRLVAMSLDGEFIRSIGEGVLTSPSGLAFDGELLWVTELYGGLVCFDLEDEAVTVVGRPREPAEEGWPNAIESGQLVRPPLERGRFRSPHGIAVAPDGTIAVTEWVIGGRLILLSPLDEDAVD